MIVAGEAKAALTACQVLPHIATRKNFRLVYRAPNLRYNLCHITQLSPILQHIAQSVARHFCFMLIFHIFYCQILMVILRPVRCGNPEWRLGEEIRRLLRFKYPAGIWLAVPAGLAVSQPTFVPAG